MTYYILVRDAKFLSNLGNYLGCQVATLNIKNSKLSVMFHVSKVRFKSLPNLLGTYFLEYYLYLVYNRNQYL